MPNANMRTYVAVAKDKLNTTLSASVAAAAVTVPVVDATGITNTSTIVIVDGTLTETRAVSAVAGNNLTVAALTNAHPGNTYVYAQPTASLGPTDYLPITGSPSFEDTIAKHPDKGYRGSNVEDYASVDGTWHSQLDFSGDFFPDTFGYLLGCILGATDFTGGTPNTHAFSGNNVGNGQPLAYAFYFFDVVNTRVYSGARIEELVIKLDPAGLITYACKAKGQPSGIVANPTPSFSSLLPVGAWRAAATVGGTLTGTLITAEINIKRNVTPVQTQDGTQGPYRVFGGALSCSGKATFIMEDDTVLLNYMNNTQPSLLFSFRQGSGASQVGLDLQMTKANYETAKPVLGGNEMFEVEVTFNALANTTDATTAGTGFSPIKATLLNAKATGTYT